MKYHIAVLVSGSGTTVEEFIRSSKTVEVKLIIVSRADAGVFDRIKKLNEELGTNIPCVFINNKTHPAQPGEIVQKGHQTAAEETAILETLLSSKYDLVANMGYMKLIGPNIIKKYGWLPMYTSVYQSKMINTHPGLLPATKGTYGINTQQFALDNGHEYAGQTLHVVGEKYDEGPTIAEHRVKIEPNDTAEGLFTKVQTIEKQYIAKDIDDFIKNRVKYLKDNEGK